MTANELRKELAKHDGNAKVIIVIHAELKPQVEISLGSDKFQVVETPDGILLAG